MPSPAIAIKQWKAAGMECRRDKDFSHVAELDITFLKRYNLCDINKDNRSCRVVSESPFVKY